MRLVKKPAKKRETKAMSPSKKAAFTAIRRVCGSRPRIIKPEEFEKLMRLLRVSYNRLNCHLRALGYSFSRRPPEADEIIAFWHREVQKVKHDPEKVVACQKKLEAAYAAVYKKIGRQPLSWPRILSQARFIRPKLPKWPVVSHGRVLTSRERVRKVVSKVCGESPGIVTPVQVKKIQRQLGGIHKKALYRHLNEMGYCLPRSPDEMEGLLKFYCAQAQKSETQEDRQALWAKLRSAIASAQQRIGRPPLKDRSIKARLNDMGLSWPRRPKAARLLEARARLKEPEDEFWHP